MHACMYVGIFNLLSTQVLFPESFIGGNLAKSKRVKPNLREFASYLGSYRFKFLKTPLADCSFFSASSLHHSHSVSLFIPNGVMHDDRWVRLFPR
jgi:hypothetical protein